MNRSRVCSSARWALAVLAVFLGSRSATAQPMYLVSHSPSPSDPTTRGAEMVEFNGLLYFGDITGLYQTDGTPGGVVLVKGGINPAYLTVMDVGGSPRLFFAAVQAGNGNELWISDGSTAGTVMLKDIRPGASSSNPTDLTVASLGGSDRLFFGANNGTTGSEPWMSDGTATGTVLIKDVNVGSADGFPSGFSSLNGMIIFANYAGPNAYWLFRTDGTAAGTVLILGPTDIHEIVAAPTQIFFYSTGTGGGYEPWRSDGTDAGTFRIKDIDPTNQSTPHDLALLGSELYFSADDSVNGDELWRSDGTDAGTVMVQQIVPGNNPYNTGPHQLVTVNGRLYFIVDDTVNGTELWTTTGGAAILVKDINPGTASSLGTPAADPVVHRPSLLNGDCVSFGQRGAPCTLITHIPSLGFDLFWADDGVHGAEPWVTDGSGAGTVRLDDIYPGVPRSHQFRSMIRIAGQTVFLTARGPDFPQNDFFSTGLWAMPLTPSLFVRPTSVLEGNAGTATATFTALLFPGSGSTVTASYATSDGTATAASGDYVAASGGVTFAPGATSQTFPVTVNGDGTPESDETFFANLSGSSGPPILVAQGKGTILNDDGPNISVNDITTLESGITQFFVTLSASSPNIVSVDYATANGSATSGSDYTAVSGTLTFAPGTTFRSLNVNITSDNVDEPNEDFFLNLSNPIFGIILDGQGQATITDDDPAPNLTVGNTTVTEPNTGTSVMAFTLNLTPASGQPVFVSFATSDATATAGSDYTATSGTLTFAPGTLTKTIPVTIIGDVVDELTETLNMNLTGAVNANITDGLGVGTITDNDTTNITINNVSVAENVAGGMAAFTVTLSTAFYQDITINYATADGTATAPADYAATSGTLTVTSGTTTAAILVPIVNENLDEPVAAETYTVNLSNNSGGNLTDALGQGSITDDDVSQIVSASVSLPEGNSGTTPFVFPMTLSGPSVNAITLSYATVNGTATSPGDYAAASGTLTFPAGSTTTTSVSVDVNGDTTSEADETFTLNLFSVVGTTATNPVDPVGTILNEDTPGFSINDPTAIEGNAGNINLTFTVSLVGTFSGNPSVDFATADGTATAPADYATSAGTLTFGPGVTTRTLVVPVVGETLDEPNETLFVNLTNPTGGVLINDAQGLGTITDNDTSTISVSNVTITEGNSGTSNMTFNVIVTVPNALGVNVDFATADATAVAPGDYLAASGTLSFPACTVLPCLPENTLQTVVVAVVGDLLDEANETFQLNLTNPVNAIIGDAQAVATITDNDASTLAVDDVSALEGDTGTSPLTFTVSLGGGKTNEVTVNYITCDPGPPANPPGCVPGTATQGADFVPASGTLTFPACTVEPCAPQSLSQTVTVDMIGEAAVEPNETFNLYLTNAVGTTIADNHGQGTILNDDGTPTLNIGDVDTLEPATGNATAAFTVTLLPPSNGAIMVNFATANGSAVAPGDYGANSGLLSFAPGDTTKTVNVTVHSDVTPEPPETYSVNLTNPTGGAAIGDGTGAGVIVDRRFSLDELDHGSRVVTDLLPPAPTLPDEDRYRIRQAPRSSYEAVVDGFSGDALPIELELLGSDNTTAVASGTPVTGGGAVSVRFKNTAATAVTNQRIRVRTGVGGCGINCDAQDLYRIRAWDTTYRVARYNNSATQVTILVIQNPTDATVDLDAWFWSGATGALNGSTTFTIPPKGVFSLNTSTVGGVAGTSGGITVTHNAPFGALIGKAVSVETATGFTFDTALESRLR